MIKTVLIRLLQLLFIVLPLKLVGILALAAYLPFMPKDKKELPKLLRWFDNRGHDLFGGQIGNKDTLLNRFNWLALRNPINTFQYEVLGVNLSGLRIEDVKIETSSPEDPRRVGDRSIDKEGYDIFTVNINGKELKGLYYVKTYNLFGLKKCIRLRIGHKIYQAFGIAPPPVAQWVFSFNPFKSHSLS